MQSPSGCLIGAYMSIASLAEEWVLEHCTYKCSGCRLYAKHLGPRSNFALDFTAPISCDFVVVNHYPNTYVY